MVEPILRDYFQQGLPLLYRKSDIILRGSERPAGIYFIEDGYIKAYQLTDEGEEHLHLIHGPGEYFPMAWAFLDITPRVYYEAITGEANLRRLAKDDFLLQARSDTAFSFALLKQSADQFFVYDQRIHNLQYCNAYQRVAYYLLSLASHFGLRQEDSILINAPISHQLIASSVNLAVETVNRELDDMQKKGLVLAQGHSMAIIDIRHMIGELGSFDRFRLLDTPLPYVGR